jgi:lycopene beta-cyclase
LIHNHQNNVEQAIDAYNTRWDFIILGMGCAGLSLAMRLADDPFFADKKIVLIDRDAKTTNDRTWCFWEKETGFFEGLVHRQWNQLYFASPVWSGQLQAAPYSYKMIRGIDFYQHCTTTLAKQPNICLLQDEVLEINEQDIRLAGGTLRRDNAQVFSSLYKKLPLHKKWHYLQQHFTGWVVQATPGSFNEKQATLMDFRVHQQHGTSFVYVMPLSDSTALVEYTVFSANLLQPAQYKIELENYLQDFLHLTDYTVKATEFGVIPMTNARFATQQNGVYHIGTAGGQTKASSGYTFQFIQKQAAQIVQRIKQGRTPIAAKNQPAGRFRLYDSTLLHILAKKQLAGATVFGRLFQKNKAALIFRFLDNETTLPQELKLMSTVQQWPFIRAAFSELVKEIAH